MNVTFFMGDKVLNIVSSDSFFKKATFSEKIVKNNFCGARAFFRRVSDLMPKINITFFNTN